jgi:hypothetical protein
MVWRRVIAIAIVVGALYLMSARSEDGESRALDVCLFLLCLVGIVAAQRRARDDDDF